MLSTLISIVAICTTQAGTASDADTLLNVIRSATKHALEPMNQLNVGDQQRAMMQIRVLLERLDDGSTISCIDRALTLDRRQPGAWSSTQAEIAARIDRIKPRPVSALIQKLIDARQGSTAPSAKNAEASGWDWLAHHPNASGSELEKVAGTMPRNDDRIKFLVKAVEAYCKTNPTYARVLANRLCDEASKKPRPKNPASEYVLAEWNYPLLPNIATIDTPKVREYLALVESEIGNEHGFRLCLAWSKLDIERATILADYQLNKYSFWEYPSCFPMMSRGYAGYLENLVKVDPKRAAKRLDDCNELGQPSFVEAANIVKKLWQGYPKQVREFCAELPLRESALYGNLFALAVDFLEMDRQARADPLNSKELLKKFISDCPPFLFMLGIGPETTVPDVIAEIARIDINRAIEMSKVQTDSFSQAGCLLAACDDSTRLLPSQQIQLIAAALSLIQTTVDAEGQTFALLSVAEAAKRALLHLQPGPPAIQK